MVFHDTVVAGNEVENVGDLVKTEDQSLVPKFYPTHDFPNHGEFMKRFISLKDGRVGISAFFPGPSELDHFKRVHGKKIDWFSCSF